jgi:hypothetical protein
MVNTGSSLDVHVRPGPLGPTCLQFLSIRPMGKIFLQFGTYILLKSQQVVKGRLRSGATCQALVGSGVFGF